MAVNGGHGAHPRLTKTNWCEGFAGSFQWFFGCPRKIRKARCRCIQWHCTRLTKTNVAWVSWGGAAGGRGQPVLGIRGNAKRWAEKLCTDSRGGASVGVRGGRAGALRGHGAGGGPVGRRPPIAHLGQHARGRRKATARAQRGWKQCRQWQRSRSPDGSLESSYT